MSITATYLYTDEKGTPLFVKDRYEPGFNGQKKTFVQQAVDIKSNRLFETDEHGKTVPKGLDGVREVLYNLSVIQNSKYVVFVEGEKDVETLRTINVPATTVHNGSNSKWFEDYANQLKGKTIYFIPDNDPPGYKLAEEFGRQFTQAGNRVLYLDWSTVDTKFYEQVKKGDISDWLSYTQNKGKFSELLKKCTIEFNNVYAALAKQIGSDAKEKANKIEWDNIIPFYNVQNPEFGKDMLPPFIDKFTDFVADTYGVEKQMPVGFFLGILGACFQKKIKFRVHEDFQGQVCVDSVVIAGAAKRKSTVYNVMIKPVEDYEEERLTQTRDLIKQQNYELQSLNMRLDELNKKASKAPEEKQLETITEEITTLRDKISELEEQKIYKYQLIFDDITPEAFKDSLYKQKGCGVISTTESGQFFSSLRSGLYSSGTNVLSVLLDGFDGGKVKINRKNSDEEYIEVRAYVSLILAAHFTKINELFANNDNHSEGIISRILFSVCDSKNERLSITAPKIIGEKNKTDYADMIKRCFEFAENIETVKMVYFAPESLKMLEQFSIYMEEKKKSCDALNLYYYDRAVMYICRISVLLTLWEQVGEQSITENVKYIVNPINMARAINIENFYLSCYNSLFYYSTPDVLKSIKIAKYLKKNSIQKINVSSLFNIFKNFLFRDRSELNCLLDELIERNIIWIKKADKNTGGRPAEILYVNPKLQQFVFSDEEEINEKSKL
ncbi:hypothetical protein FACS1894132_09820 [Clostridia bacterium]|nr:hypothetical protein FACS1894132_09820 [Clostridia bacterium]